MLQNGKIILLLALFINGPIYAKSFPPSIGTPQGCSVNVVTKNKTTTANLKCKNITFSKEQEFLDSKFLRWGLLKGNEDTYVLMYFTNGVHGESVYVFSKVNGKKLIEIPSSWPIELEKEKNTSKINYKKDSDSKGKYKSYYYILK